MARTVEQLSGGLITARDPSTLAPGELQFLQNSVYAPGNVALQRARGRVVFGTVTATATPVRGLRDIQFDNSDHYVVAMASAVYSTAVVGDTGTFATSFGLSGVGSSLDAVHNLDEWFLFSGVGSTASSFGTGSAASASSILIQNLVGYVSATAPGTTVSWRSHGMIPVTTAPNIVTGAGVWTAPSTGFFEYWTTEVFNYTKDGVVNRLESTFAGDPTTILINTTAAQATVNIPGPQANVNAQEWRLYRAGQKALASDKLFPVGFLIASGTFASGASALDGGATTSPLQSVNATQPFSPQFASATNIFSSNDQYATHTGATLGYLAGSFATFAVNEPIVGVEVLVEAKKAGGTLSVKISGDAGATWSNPKGVGLTLVDTISTLGSPIDTWGLNLGAASFTSGNFRILLTSFGDVSVDHVQARITYAGTKSTSETPFPAVILEIGGVDASVGSHGLPPVATTGDIFQGSLVTNNISAPANIVYSLPDQVDYFPSVYFIDFETPDNDRVTNIKTLNNRLGVFLTKRLYRVNYLPTESDAKFSRGLCREEVSSEVGCVNEMCATTFTGADGRTNLAFASNIGIFSTDLFTLVNLTTDLDWRGIISTTATSTYIALINNPEERELLFYYRNDALGNDTYKCLHLNYDNTHIRENGQLKISGQVNMRNYNISTGDTAELFSAWKVPRISGDTNILLGYGGSVAAATAAGAGKVYRESGSTIPARDNTMNYTTRRMFLGGLGNELEVREIYTYIDLTNSASAQNWIMQPQTLKTNDPNGVVSQTSKTFPWNGHGIFKYQFQTVCEGLQLEFFQAAIGTASDKPFSVQYHAFTHEDFGEEDSGR